MHIGVAELVVGCSAILAGAVVQGSIGFGINLLAAPFVAIVAPEALPASLVLLAFPLAVAIAARDRHALDGRALRWMLLGALPGTGVGLLIVHAFGGDDLATVVGTITLTGVALSIFSPPIPLRAPAAVTAGFASNVFGTASSVGGPPVALLFQHHEGSVARSTLGAFFATSAVFSLIGYSFTGDLDADRLLYALTLAPAGVAGWWASRHLHPFVDGGWLRPAVLMLSAIAGATAIARGLL